MESGIFYVTSEEMDEIRECLAAEAGIWIAEIDGRQIPRWDDYSKAIGKVMNFPRFGFVENMDGYEDWMLDLDWLESSSYAVIIYNYSKFLAKDLEAESWVVDHFSTCIIPYWQNEACPKASFAVYLGQLRKNWAKKPKT
jgi:hypothetical protein